jgi:ferredoxin
MKFLCDAERCIECNACVTACKNEHEVPWGINRRRVVTIQDGKPGERSISVACMHCSDAPLWQCVQLIVFIKQIRVLFYILKIYASDVVTASMLVLSELRNFLKLEIMDLGVRWINVLSAQVDLKMIWVS